VVSGPSGRVAMGEPVGDRRIGTDREQPGHEVTISARRRGVNGGAMPVIPRRFGIDRGTLCVQRFVAATLAVVDRHHAGVVDQRLRGLGFNLCSAARRIHDDTDRSSASAAVRTFSTVSGANHTGASSVSLAVPVPAGPGCQGRLLMATIDGGPTGVARTSTSRSGGLIETSCAGVVFRA